MKTKGFDRAKQCFDALLVACTVRTAEWVCPACCRGHRVREAFVLHADGTVLARRAEHFVDGKLVCDEVGLVDSEVDLETSAWFSDDTGGVQVVACCDLGCAAEMEQLS
jgi:hypothetical protein